MVEPVFMTSVCSRRWSGKLEEMSTRIFPNVVACIRRHRTTWTVNRQRWVALYGAATELAVSRANVPVSAIGIARLPRIGAHRPQESGTLIGMCGVQSVRCAR